MIISIIPLTGMSQTDVNNDLKPFYSFYLYEKLNYRWSMDLFTLVAMKIASQDFWLAQFSLGANYKINRFYEISVGYGQAHYNYGNENWWKSHYPGISPSGFKTAIFHTASMRIKRDDNIGKKLKLSNRFIIQQYFPGFEKYKTRLQYSAKFSYRRSDLPIRLKPFFQGAIYYYLNGIPINYYDTNLNIVDNAAPNGLHRYRIKIGASFNPIEANRNLALVLYFAFNREFNGSGNDINVMRPSQSGKAIFTSYQFNNYNILGLQVNYFL